MPTNQRSRRVCHFIKGYMKITLLLLVLAVSSPAQRSDDTIALVFGPTKVQIVTVAEAESTFHKLRKLKSLSAEQQRMLAALVIALGTRPDPAEQIPEGFTREESERFRWRRLPLNGSFRGRGE